ncbi:esterase/lipase family protein [Agromyces binzhouensis]|uniref:esterase/lipase family protein n=1 Tax=Agromyces binzhouensis TaxID=1817495 RepID=UPI0036285132
MTITPFAFIVPIDPGAVEAVLETDSGTDTEESIRTDTALRARELRGLLQDEPIESVILWRLYRGSNSSAVDGLCAARDGVYRIGLGVVEGAAYLVGRLAMTVNRRMRRPERDPWMHGRLDRAIFDDLMLKRKTAEECPELRHLPPGGVGPAAIIAVHGTMACGIPLARSLAVDMAGSGPILRFEHDTWNAIPENARDLADGIQAAGLRKVLLVAHSRGGLVCRQAMGYLRDADPEIDVRLVAVGTPFAGTPMIGAAESGLLGMRVALGALRLLTGPVLDGVSRLAGVLIKGHLPRGLRDMHPDETYLKAFAGTSTSEILAVAGHVDPNGPHDSYGVATAAASGSAGGIFLDPATGAELLNDYVVPTESASHRIPTERTLRVECDHFSFFSHPEVRVLLHNAVLRSTDEGLTW